jgi:hypothetical protein
MDIWGPMLIWCRITCHVIIQNFWFKKKLKKITIIIIIYNLISLQIMDSQIVFLSQHVMWQNTCHAKFEVKKKNISSNFDTIWHDVHMFVNNIYTIYIHALIHQGLNLRPHGSTLRSYPPNHFKILITK